MIHTTEQNVRKLAFKNPGHIVENKNSNTEKCCYFDTKKCGKYKGDMYVEIIYHNCKKQYLVGYYVSYPNLTTEYQSGEKFFNDYHSAYKYFLRKIKECYDFWNLKPVYEIRFQGNEIFEETEEIKIRNNMIIDKNGNTYDRSKFTVNCKLY